MLRQSTKNGGRMSKEQSFFPLSRCFCAARDSVNIHFPCQNCQGKVVNPKTLFFNERETIEEEHEVEIDLSSSCGKF